MKKHQKTQLKLPDGRIVDAVAPVVISASRATDIPALYGEWLLNRLKAGYAAWRNPYNGRTSYVDFCRSRAIVFWTKNPAPFLPMLQILDDCMPQYYFQFTLNDYEQEGLEPGLPSLEYRIAVFQELSRRIGSEKLIWRFDPIIFGGQLDAIELLRRISRIAEALSGYTQTLVFSFADIDRYVKVRRSIAAAGGVLREPYAEEKEQIAAGLAAANIQWGLSIRTCAEGEDFSIYDVEHNRCIDDRLLASLFPQDRLLSEFVESNMLFADNNGNFMLKDAGQRPNCGCILSKDIGQYSTCPQGCLYCYAVVSRNAAKAYYLKHDASGELLARV